MYCHFTSGWGMSMGDSYRKMRRYAILAAVFGFLGIVGLMLSHLALVDIHHAEKNVFLEWLVVQVTVVFVILFHIAVGLLLYHLFVYLKDNPNQSDDDMV